MKCFYHSADLDGQCSGAIIKMRFPECELIGINFGDDFPWDDIEVDETVFMVDFSLQPFAGMDTLNRGCDLIWIDHHKSAVDDALDFNADQLHKVDGRVIDLSNSVTGIGACALVWDYCYPGKDRPKAVQLLAEYDVWNHTDMFTLPFQWGIRMMNTKPDEANGLWGSILSDDFSDITQQILQQGNIILKYVAQDNRKYMEACGFETELDGLKCIAINRMLTNSQMFDSIWDEARYDAMLTFGWRKGSWTVSLYSTKDCVDVSVTAKNRGGGGHKGAAGFQCSELPFETR